MTEDRLLTVTETAALTKFSEVSIRRWIREGLLEAERVGPHRRVRIRLAVVWKFFPDLAAKKNESPAITSDHPE